MNEANQSCVSDSKKRFRNFAAWHAILVPAICGPFFNTASGFHIPVAGAAFIFTSALVMGILSLFGNSVRGVTRALVFVGMLVSAVCGGLALFLCFLYGFRC